VVSHTNLGEIMPECWFKGLVNEDLDNVSSQSEARDVSLDTEIRRFLRFLAHASTHRNCMDMGPTANERGRQTTSSIRTLYFLEVILGTWGGGMCENRPILEVFGSQINRETCYGHGTDGK
jgi:hypothetical protein